MHWESKGESNHQVDIFHILFHIYLFKNENAFQGYEAKVVQI
jgi:hypothetical protein